MYDSPNSGLKNLLERHREALERGDESEAESLALQYLEASAEVPATPGGPAASGGAARSAAGPTDWRETERTYRAAVQTAANAMDDAQAFRAHLDLSSLYDLLDRHDEALSEARNAVIAARRLDASESLAVALVACGRELLHYGNINAACSAADEILAITGNEPDFALSRARGLSLRALCELAQGNAAEARRRLDEAGPLLLPHAGSQHPPGYQAALAHWWHATALARFHGGDYAGAAEAMRSSLQHSRNVAAQPSTAGPFRLNGLARSLHRLAILLIAAGTTEEASAAFLESRALRASIELQPIE